MAIGGLLKTIHVRSEFMVIMVAMFGPISFASFAFAMKELIFGILVPYLFLALPFVMEVPGVDEPFW